jgi:hypothetical protein
MDIKRTAYGGALFIGVAKCNHSHCGYQSVID